jgi:hypothetical protein
MIIYGLLAGGGSVDAGDKAALLHGKEKMAGG